MLIPAFRGPGRVFGFAIDPDGANLPSRHAQWAVLASLEMFRDDHHAGVDVNGCLDDADAHNRIDPSTIA